jgi:hypothetical protein
VRAYRLKMRSSTAVTAIDSMTEPRHPSRLLKKNMVVPLRGVNAERRPARMGGTASDCLP